MNNLIIDMFEKVYKELILTILLISAAVVGDYPGPVPAARVWPEQERGVSGGGGQSHPHHPVD